MPTISRFRGITITMYFDESLHSGRSHFHALYGGCQASFDVLDLTRLAGKLPPRIERLVRDWASEHQPELIENWERGRRHQPPRRIDPLK
jgi:hypothetical protein